jgi:hypothetical protein
MNWQHTTDDLLIFSSNAWDPSSKHSCSIRSAIPNFTPTQKTLQSKIITDTNYKNVYTLDIYVNISVITALHITDDSKVASHCTQMYNLLLSSITATKYSSELIGLIGYKLWMYLPKKYDGVGGSIKETQQTIIGEKLNTHQGCVGTMLNGTWMEYFTELRGQGTQQPVTQPFVPFQSSISQPPVSTQHISSSPPFQSSTQPVSSNPFSYSFQQVANQPVSTTNPFTGNPQSTISGGWNTTKPSWGGFGK